MMADLPTPNLPISTTASQTWSVSARLHHAYVATMLDVVGRSLVMASKIDEEVRHELSGLPTGLTVAMTVFGTSLGFMLQVVQDETSKHLVFVSEPLTKAALNIRFKHLNHAYLVLSFQEGTAQAFAHDRMMVDGDLSHAVRLVRCLNRLEALILPKMLARLAVKQYPTNLSLADKLMLATKVYARVLRSYLGGK